MTARRTEIRDAVAAALVGINIGGAAVSIHKSRTRLLRPEELPALLVFSGVQEPQGAYLPTGLPVAHTWRIRVDVLVKDNDNPEAQADEILEQVVQHVLTDTPLAALVSGVSFVGVGEPDLDETTEKPAVRVPSLFEIIYS